MLRTHTYMNTIHHWISIHAVAIRVCFYCVHLFLSLLSLVLLLLPLLLPLLPILLLLSLLVSMAFVRYQVFFSQIAIGRKYSSQMYVCLACFVLQRMRATCKHVYVWMKRTVCRFFITNFSHASTRRVYCVYATETEAYLLTALFVYVCCAHTGLSKCSDEK